MTLLRRFRRLAAQQCGTSMVELLTVTIILGTVIGALTVLFVQASNAEFEMNRRFQAQQAARVAVDKMRREIHCSSLISPSGASTSITVTLPAQCPSAGGSQITVIYDFSQVVAGQRYRLRRNSVVLADYVAPGYSFSYAAPVASTSLGKLKVTLPINTTPSNGVKEWRLVADIVLRNTSR